LTDDRGSIEGFSKMSGRLRVGVLGAGFISDYHIEGLQAAGAEVVSLYSRTERKAREKAMKYGIGHSCGAVSEVLERGDIDLVVIATQDFTHEKLAIATAQAGKAILLQKPMARSAQEARRIVQAAQEAGVPLVVSFMHRYFEEVVAVRQLLSQGVLGQIHQIRQRNATPGADWADWFYDKEQSGGVVMQLGVHGIDLLRYLFADIEAVKAVTYTSGIERALADGTRVRPDNEDLAVAIYRLTSGVTAVHEMSYQETAGTDRFRMEIYGDLGTAWLRSEKGRLAYCMRTNDGQREWINPVLPEPRFGARHHEHVLAMVQGDLPLDSSAHDGVASLLVAEAIYASASSGQWTVVSTA